MTDYGSQHDDQPRGADEEEEVERDLEDVCIIKPLDGGYGWVIVFASFICNAIVDGIIFTAGESLLGLWISDFDTSDTAVSLTMSILSGCYLLVGPLASALANLYGCRAVVIAGACLSFFGFLCSTIAPQVWFLYISFGLVGGIGFGLIYLPAIVIISQYFSTKRSLATGLAVCGSGIGTTILSTVNPYVMDLLGNNWRLFLVYLAVCCLTCVLAALVYKPMTASPVQIEQVTRIAESVTERKHSVDGTCGLMNDTGRPRFNSHRPFLSTIELNTHKSNSTSALSQHDLAQAVARDSVRDLNRPLSKMDVFYSGSTNNIRQRSHTVSDLDQSIFDITTIGGDEYYIAFEEFDYQSRMLADPVNRIPSNSQTDIKSEASLRQSNIYLSQIGLPGADFGSQDTASISWKQNLLATLKTLLDTSLLYSPSFLILAVSGFLTLCCFYVPYNYIGQHVNKIPDITASQKTMPISVLGVVNIFGRIICGYIADQPQVDALLVSNISLIFAGIVTLLVPFYTQYWMFIAFCVPFGCGAACFAALRSVICVDLFGLDKLSNAFGILLMFMGVGAVIGTPLAAFIKDMTGNFDVSFYIMGVLMSLSGAVCLPLRSIRKWELKRISAADALSKVELEKLA